MCCCQTTCAAVRVQQVAKPGALLAVQGAARSIAKDRVAVPGAWVWCGQGCGSFCCQKARRRRQSGHSSPHAKGLAFFPMIEETEVLTPISFPVRRFLFP